MNTACPLYNNGLYIEKLNATEARVSMCCLQNLSQKTYTQVDFDRNGYLESIRQKVKTQEQISECDHCWQNESNGNQSYRQGQIAAFNQLGIAVDGSTDLVSMTYNCQNTCNLKCITCGPRYSSLWVPEYKKLNLKIALPKTVKNLTL